MKVALFLVACLAITQAKFLATPVELLQEVPTLPYTINGTVLDLNDYYNGIWAFFNLTQTNAITCWNDVTAETYFEYLQAFYDMCGAFVVADQVNVNIYFAQVVALNATMYEPIQCVLNSQDYQNLLVAMNVSNFNKSVENILQEIYYQGHIGDWYLAWGPIYNLLTAASYNDAGYAYAPVLQTMSNNGSHTNAFFEALEAFQNGIFFWTNLTTPFELPLCYNDSSAHNFISFIFLWSQTVYNSTVGNVVNNTNSWFANQGAQLLPLLEPIFNCEDTTGDQSRLNAALGVDIHSQAFQTDVNNYINNDTQTYFNIFSKMYDLFINYNPLAAGIVYGEFLVLVAASANAEISA